MQYIQYCKINPNRHLFVIFPTQVKNISFGKKMSIKQRLRVGDIFAPNLFIWIGISSVYLLIYGFTPLWFF